MTHGMRRFVVEVRATYEVEAESPDAALGSVRSPEDRYGAKPIATEYTVRERSAAPAPAKASEVDSHGLTKPVYTTAEAAAIMGIGRSTMYELARRTDGIKSIRLGRKALILQLELVLDACRGAVARATWDADQHGQETRGLEIESNERYREFDKALDHLDSVLDDGKTALEFMKHILDSAPKIHHALHLIAIGDPTGITSLLLIIFAAAGYTLVDELDLETVSLEFVKDASPRPLCISIEVWDAIETSWDIGKLVREDRDLWRGLEPSAIRVPVHEIQSEMDRDDDLHLSL